MAKWIFTRVGTWEYPTFGIRATTGDVLEADNAPDAYWDSTDAGSAETVEHIHNPVSFPVFVEPADGTPLVYDSESHGYVVGADTIQGLVTDALSDDTTIADAAVAAVETAGAFRHTGTGFPEGVVTAPPGDEYTDTAGTAGARKWLKATGTGNTGWVLLNGDTGERNVATAVGTSGATGVVARLRREGAFVHLYISFTTPASVANAFTVYNVPVGFRPVVSELGPNTNSGKSVTYASTGDVTMTGTLASTVERIHAVWTTADAWPATLP